MIFIVFNKICGGGLFTCHYFFYNLDMIEIEIEIAIPSKMVCQLL